VEAILTREAKLNITENRLLAHEMKQESGQTYNLPGEHSGHFVPKTHKIILVTD
jgi:hypothetical protein